jgi:hypothetical protein
LVLKPQLLLLLIQSTLYAASINTNWTGAINNAYTNPGNWDNGVPNNSGPTVFNAFIAAPFNNSVLLQSSAVIDSLTLSNSAGLTVGNSNSFTVNTSAVVNPGSSLLLNTGTNASLTGLANLGTVSSYGNLSLTSLVNGGTVQLLGGAQMTSSGFTNFIGPSNGQFIVNASTLTVNSGVINGGTIFAQNAGIMNFNGNIMTGDVTVSTSAVLNLNGATLFGTNQIGATGTMVSAATSINTLASLINAGHVSVSSSTLNLNAGGTYTNNGILSLGNNGLVIAQINGPNTTLTIGGSGIIDLQNGTLVAGAVLGLGSGQTVQGTGAIVGTGSVTNQGTIHASSGSGITIFPSSFTNNGTIVADTPVLFGSGSLTNYANNTLTGGSYDISSVLGIPGADIRTNQASITLHDTGQIAGNGNALANFNLNDTGAGFTITGNAVFVAPAGGFTNNGAVDIGAGSVFVLNSGDPYTQNGGSTIVDGQLLQAGTVTLNGGTLSGIGQIHGNLVNNGATITPGDAPGPLSVFGDYIQSAASELDIEFAMQSAYGQLNIFAPLATIQGGALRFIADPGFDAPMGQIFWILTAGQVSGDFDSFTTNYFAGSKMFKEVIAPNAIGAQVVAAPEPGSALMVALILVGASALLRRRLTARVHPPGTCTRAALPRRT